MYVFKILENKIKYTGEFINNDFTGEGKIAIN